MRIDQLEVTETVKNVVNAAYRNSTKTQYNGYLGRWQRYCLLKSVNMYKPQVNDVLNFLGVLFDLGLGYSAINAARSSLSTIILIDKVPVGRHPLVKQMLSGVFNLRPPLPKYVTVWRVDVVLNYIMKLPRSNRLSPRNLTMKLCILLALATGQRGQSLSYMKISKMDIANSLGRVTFYLDKPIKNYRKGGNKSVQIVSVKGHAPNRKVCPISCLNAYLELSKRYRNGEDALFLSYQKPHHPVAVATLRRWIVQILSDAGIDTSTYKAHSTRGASVSKARIAGVSISDIIGAAGWNNSSTFTKHYLRPIQASSDDFMSKVFS